jgi:hypothetical protein
VGVKEDVVHADQEDRVDPVTDQPDQPGGRHHAKDGDERHPLIDMNRDPNPGVADHAVPEEGDD